MKKLLIVDDEENLLRLYRMEFEADGYQVATAQNSREALSIFDQKGCDLVILDVRMPGMDGVEALGKFLGRRNKLPVILNTAYDSYKDNFMCWAADDYVVKSSDLTELKTKVRTALGQNTFVFN